MFGISTPISRYHSPDEKAHCTAQITAFPTLTHSPYTAPNRGHKGHDEKEDEEVEDLLVDLAFHGSSFVRRLAANQNRIVEVDLRGITHEFRLVAGIDDDAVDPFRIA